MDENIKKLINTIDSRSCETKDEYFGNVLSVQDGYNSAKVQLSGTDIEVILLNKTGEILSVNDSVIIKAVNGDMSNAIISYRFGTPKPISPSSPSGDTKIPSITYSTATETDKYQEFSNGTELRNFIVNNGKNFIGELKVTCDNSITDCSELFTDCSEVTFLDLKDFDTSNVTNMSNMFSGASALTNIYLGEFNTSKVTNMNSMFESCRGLTFLNLKDFDTSKVTDMGYMFYNCTGLLSLNITSFNTGKVTNMAYMIGQCRKITDIDLRYFDTTNVANTNHMFYNDILLKRIYCGKDWNTDTVTDSASMFQRCTSLSGAINYSSSNVDISYANPDTGYFKI